MFKFLLIIFLISYLIYKLGGIMMRVFFAKAFQQQHAYQQNQQNQTQRRKSGNGNIHIDYVPEDKSKKDGHMKGGEYVDYEDVKD